MILGDPKKWDELAEAGVYGTLTLDEMLQRAAAEESGTQAALGDFVNEALTWAQLEARVARIADFLLDQGLKRDDTVVSLCGGGVNAIVTLLALSRAGMVALPLSPLTGARDLAEICEQFGARAIITETRVGPRQTAQTAAMAAFSAFHIRFLMAWGTDLPDGVISLDEVLDLPPDENQTPATAMRGGRASDHVFVMTGDGDGDSRAFPARNHGQLVATAMPLTLKARLTANSVIATPMVASSLCGLSIVAAWLMTRSHLHYLPAWQVDGFAEAAKMAGATHLAIPGRLAGKINAVELGMTQIRMWRDHVDSDIPGPAGIDAASLGEAALMVWDSESERGHIPLGGLRLVPGASEVIVEPRIQGLVHKAQDTVEPGSLMRGPLCVRGSGTPTMAHPRDQAGKDRFTQAGFMLTGLRGELVEADGPNVRILGSAQLRYRSGHMELDLASLDTLYSSLESVEEAVAIPVAHPILGDVVTLAYRAQERLDLESVINELDALGASAHKFPVAIVKVETIPRDENGEPTRELVARERIAV